MGYRECTAQGEPIETCIDPITLEKDSYHTNIDGLNNLAYIKHFNTKSLQEFLELKFTRGYPIPYRHSGLDLDLNDYFKTNKITKEKLDYIQAWLDKYKGPKNKIQLQQQLDEYRKELE